MSVALAFPLGLAALAALLVPLLLHLLRRAEHRTTPFAALKFLRAAGLPRRRIRVAEPALLALRCALLAVVALALAQPLLRREAAPRHVVAVAPGVDPARVTTAAGAEARWLAPGFPPLAQAPPDAFEPAPSLASVLRELDHALAPGSRIDVVVPEIVDGLDAERPRLSREVGWRVVPGARGPDAASAPARPRRLLLHAAADDTAARRHLEAAIAAWNAAAPGTASLAQYAGGAIPEGTTALVWLEGALTADAKRWIDTGGTALVAGPEDVADVVIARDPDGAPLLRERRQGRGRVLVPAVPFAPAQLPLLNEPAFAAALAAWLDGPPEAPRRAAADALAPVRGTVGPDPPAEPLAPWLALLAAASFVLERVWASGMRRRSLA